MWDNTKKNERNGGRVDLHWFRVAQGRYKMADSGERDSELADIIKAGNTGFLRILPCGRTAVPI
jgi:hypothetical protein